MCGLTPKDADDDMLAMEPQTGEIVDIQIPVKLVDVVVDKETVAGLQTGTPIEVRIRTGVSMLEGETLVLRRIQTLLLEGEDSMLQRKTSSLKQGSTVAQVHYGTFLLLDVAENEQKPKQDKHILSQKAVRPALDMVMGVHVPVIMRRIHSQAQVCQLNCHKKTSQRLSQSIRRNSFHKHRTIHSLEPMGLLLIMTRIRCKLRNWSRIYRTR